MEARLSRSSLHQRKIPFFSPNKVKKSKSIAALKKYFKAAILFLRAFPFSLL